MDSNATPPFSSPPIAPPPPGPSSYAPPPPSYPPPPYIAAPTPPPPRRGRGWMVVAIILLLLLILSVLVNFGQLTSSVVRVPGGRAHTRARMAGPRLDEVILEENNAANKIAVIDVDGIITSRAIDQGGFTMVDLIKEQLDLAK